MLNGRKAAAGGSVRRDVADRAAGVGIGAERFRRELRGHVRFGKAGIFSDKAKLDEGHMWPTAFALKELTAAEEAKIGALVKKAVS